MNLDKEFKEALERKQKSYGRLVQMQKRIMDEWAMERFVENGYENFKLSYMPFLMNIGEHGITNKALASKASVTKQAMSKVIRELEEQGLVTSKPNKNDARSIHIELTEKGKMLVIRATSEMCGKREEYENLVGKKRFQEAIDTMYTILQYEMEKRGKTL